MTGSFTIHKVLGGVVVVVAVDDIIGVVDGSGDVADGGLCNIGNCHG